MADNNSTIIREEKRIHELESLLTLKDDAYIVLDQDNLTRKVSLLHLRLSFIADGSHDSKFYTSEVIDQKLNSIYKSILELSNSINKFPSEIEEISNNIISIRKDIDSLRERIEKIEERLNNLYDWGTEIPTTLETGKLYFQYFIN